MLSVTVVTLPTFVVEVQSFGVVSQWTICASALGVPAARMDSERPMAQACVGGSGRWSGLANGGAR
jgi:hypothetical protein